MNKSNIKLKKWLIGLLVASILCFILIKLIEGFESVDKSMRDDLPSSYSFVLDDSILFSKDFIKRLSVNEIFRSKIRAPISFLILDRNYHLIKYKIKVSQDISLSDILDLKKTHALPSIQTAYRVIHEANFNLHIEHDSITTVSKIYMTFYGDSINEFIHNDSTIGFRLNLNNLSIRYLKNEKYDIVFQAVENGSYTSNLSAQFLFIKKGKDVYFIMLIPIEGTRFLESDLLHDLIYENSSK